MSTEPSSLAEPQRLVPAVERAVRLIDALAQSRRPRSLAELARDLELPKSSVHGLLATLQALRLVNRADDGSFTLGTRALRWAGAYADQSDVVTAFYELADAANALHEEAVMLAVLDGAEVLYIACRPGTRPLGVNFRVGGRFPAHCTSTGKAMLALLDDAGIATLLGPAPLPGLTRHSHTDPAALALEIGRTRARGYAVDDEETAEGMHCFGAAVRSGLRPGAIAAVGVSLIKAQTSAARRGEIIAEIQAFAERLSRRLGADEAPAC